MAPRKKVTVSGKKGDLRRVITITVDADEETLDRLATLMLFAKPPMAWKEYEEPPLPWPLGDVGAPEGETKRPPRMPEEATRTDITKRLSEYIKAKGLGKAKALLADFGAEKVSDLQGEAMYLFHQRLVQEESAA